LDRIEAINIRANAALVSIRDYIGCASIIRSALGDSKNNELQVSCFEGVSPNIKEISGFYNLSVDIGNLKLEFICLAFSIIFVSRS